METNKTLSRRYFLGMTGIAALGATGCLKSKLGYDYQTATNRNISLPETPQCSESQETTSAAAEGPFYTRKTPHRDNLIVPGMQGNPVIIVGQVLTPDCQPIQGVVLDFWQADHQGEYDNDGYKLRGHQFSNDKGLYQLTTIIPARYSVWGFERPRHIHVKVQGKNTILLTTQLFFNDDLSNSRDSLFREDLLIFPKPNRDGIRTAVFNFVIS